MKVNIEKKIENPLLKRKEIIAVVTDLIKTPSREEMVKQIAALTGSSPDQVIIDQIKQEFGGEKATITAKVYETKKFRDSTELKYKIKRITPKVEEKKEEASTEEKKPEEPKIEEKKEGGEQ